jgi:hypothetical protein
MSEDTKNTQIALKEALVLFEASFVQYTKKPTQSNIDELISSGQSYKELWIMAISNESMDGSVEKLNETLALSSRKLDYKKSDEIYTRLENLEASTEEHETTLKNAVKETFENLNPLKLITSSLDRIELGKHKVLKNDNFYGNDLYRRAISVIRSEESLSKFADDDIRELPFLTMRYKDSFTVQQTQSKEASITTTVNVLPDLLAQSANIDPYMVSQNSTPYDAVINIDQIVPSNFINEKISLESMEASMSIDGLHLPIHVFKEVDPQKGSTVNKPKYRIIDGDKRFLAAKSLHWSNIPVVVNPIGVLGTHNFQCQNISARGLNLDGTTYTRRWYYEQPSQETLLKWHDQIKNTKSDEAKEFLELINEDLGILKNNLSSKKKDKLNLRDAWWVGRPSFEDLIMKANKLNQFAYKFNDKRDSWYPESEMIISEQLSKDELKNCLSTFSLPHERFQFNLPHVYFAFKDSIQHKGANDIIVMPNSSKDFLSENQRIWRDVIIYTPNSVTIRSATTNLKYKNKTLIPDNSDWVISNDMPSLSNQTIKAFINQISPEIANQIRIKDKEQAKENFKNA